MTKHQIDMKRKIKDHTQTFLYIATENIYYCFLQAQIIKALKEHNPNTRHVVVPCFGIRQHESDESRKLPRRLKRLQASWYEKEKERSRAMQCVAHIRHFLDQSLAGDVHTITYTNWLKHLSKAKCSAAVETMSKMKRRLEYNEGLSINGILCGDLCADTYMRYKPDISVDARDPYFKKTVTRAMALIQFYRELIRNYKPTILIGTDTTYVHHGIPHRVAAQANIPSISLAGLEESFKLNMNRNKYSIHRSSQPSYCRNYPAYTRGCESEIPEVIYKKASESLKRRVNNIYDATFTYMKKGLDSTCDAAESCNGRVLIMLHDFFDASHIYRWKIFSDFYAWAHSTISFCIHNNIPVAVKPHPAQISESERVVKMLKELHATSKQILWIDKSQKNSSLFKSNPALIVSMYGSVAAEATYAGIPVLLAGDHPGINFDIGHTAKDQEEYFSIIRQYKQAKQGLAEDAISFTAQHYYNNFARKFDSLKSRISQDEGEWNRYSNYQNHQVINYAKEFRIALIKRLQGESIL